MGSRYGSPPPYDLGISGFGCVAGLGDSGGWVAVGAGAGTGGVCDVGTGVGGLGSSFTRGATGGGAGVTAGATGVVPLLISRLISRGDPPAGRGSPAGGSGLESGVSIADFLTPRISFTSFFKFSPRAGNSPDVLGVGGWGAGAALVKFRFRQ